MIVRMALVTICLAALTAPSLAEKKRQHSRKSAPVAAANLSIACEPEWHKVVQLTDGRLACVEKFQYIPH